MKNLLLIVLIMALFACGGGESSDSSNDIKSSYSSNDCLFNIEDDEIFYDAFQQFGSIYKISFDFDDETSRADLKITDVVDAPGPFKSTIYFNKDGEGFVDVDGFDVQRLSHKNLDFKGQCGNDSELGRFRTRIFLGLIRSDFIPVEVSSGVFVGPNASYYPLDRRSDFFSKAVFTLDGVLYSHKDYITAGILIDGSAKLVIASSLGVTVLDLQ